MGQIMKPSAMVDADGTLRVPGVEMSRDARQLFALFLHVNKELDDFQRAVLTKVLGPKNTAETIREAIVNINQKYFLLSREGWQPTKAEGDAVNLPDHYGRFPMEPTYFIVSAGGFHWCIENFIKYIVRFPFKNGLEDLRKANRNLDMYLRHQEGDERWSL